MGYGEFGKQHFLHCQQPVTIDKAPLGMKAEARDLRKQVESYPRTNMLKDVMSR